MSGPCPQRAPSPAPGRRQRRRCATPARQNENWPPGCLGASLSSRGSGAPRCGVKWRCAECCQRRDYLRSEGRTPALNWCERQMAATAPRFCAIARQWQIWQCAPTASDILRAMLSRSADLIAAFFAGAKLCEIDSPRSSSLTGHAAAPKKDWRLAESASPPATTCRRARPWPPLATPVAATKPAFFRSSNRARRKAQLQAVVTMPVSP